MAGCKGKGKNDWVEFSAFVRDQVFYFVFNGIKHRVSGEGATFFCCREAFFVHHITVE